MIFALLTILATVTLAFANGGNDVSKGVATLVGSGRASYRRAIAWGTLWTAVGGGAALIISVGLVKAFTSALVGPALLASPAFPLAIAMGAAAWVLLASATGLPVSTTHALTGAIIGAAMTAGGAGTIRWELLLTTIALPLAVSPLVSAGIGYGLYGVGRPLVAGLRVRRGRADAGRCGRIGAGSGGRLSERRGVRKGVRSVGRNVAAAAG